MKRWLRRIAIAVGVSLAGVYGALVFLLWWQQDALTFVPSRGYRELPENQGLTHEDVNIAIAPDTKIRGWLIPAVGKPRATILFFHGNGGNLSSNISLMLQFAVAGFDSFSIDYEGYGDSGGVPSEAHVYRDADAAWDWLTTTRGVDPKHIAIWGHSLGGGIATHCAETHKAGALVLQSTFTTIPDVGATIYFWLPVRLLAHNHFDNLGRIRRIHTPVLVSHGRGDGLIPFEMGRSLFDAANEPKKFVELKGGHEDGFAQTPSAWSDVKKLFEEAGVAEPR